MYFKIAFRNILRNRRRSTMTLLAIAMGSIAVVLFGEFIGFIRASLETNAVQNVGHLSVFRKGYFDYGAGSPASFGLDHYEELIHLIQDDPEIGPKLRVITPIISLSGIAGNFDIDASKTFLGVGYVPVDHERMRDWDEHRVGARYQRVASGLSEHDESVGVVGVGLARVLGLCEQLGIADCPARPSLQPQPTAAPAEDLPALAPEDVEPHDATPSLELLAATANGAPNVMRLKVSRAEPQGARELDENMVIMHFALAQKLLFGRNERKAGGVVLQLARTEDIAHVRASLEQLFASHQLELEVRDFAEREPFYVQAVGMFSAIFLFISLIMGVIVLFTVVNTMGMSVVERTVEIGTSRAMGLRRAGVRRLFLLEGALLGTFGATFGVLAGQSLALLFNQAGATWTPPGRAAPVPLELLTTDRQGLLIATWLLLVAIATVAALVPANRAARLQVVDALRHV